jgi:hypothetical protein
MGIIEFFILCFVVVLFAGLLTWGLGQLVPDHPALIDRVIWFVAVVVILFALIQATGILGHDPRIPHV